MPLKNEPLRHIWLSHFGEDSCWWHGRLMGESYYSNPGLIRGLTYENCVLHVIGLNALGGHSTKFYTSLDASREFIQQFQEFFFKVFFHDDMAPTPRPTPPPPPSARVSGCTVCHEWSPVWRKSFEILDAQWAVGIPI